jgi:hypothetical protein
VNAEQEMATADGLGGDAQAPTFEFESVADATLRETWRVSVRDGDKLSSDELADCIEEELTAGRCEFVSEQAEEERNRDVRRESIERVERPS